MKALIQKVKEASVTVDNQIIGSIKKGFVIFLGVRIDDNEKDVEFLAKKVSNLRVFEDKQERMNLSVQDVNCEALIISQFTLYADTKKGNRPGFTDAAPPELANKLYKLFILKMQQLLGKNKIATGKFRAHMDVALINNGPVTVEISSDYKKK
ncbi:MAG: D-aminoacyl-tRNA deacylase [Kiritimatiellae bacterium]|jgi:D-tyrosyl-tRNA(Tyr) deacylase|nr:D-aminoacyl-tRNA deacylase [Kiritimatiellia bacterium]